MKECMEYVEKINNALGTEAVRIEELNNYYAIFVKYEDKLNYGISCADEDSLWDELSSLFKGIELAKAVFNIK